MIENDLKKKLLEKLLEVLGDESMVEEPKDLGEAMEEVALDDEECDLEEMVDEEEEDDGVLRLSINDMMGSVKTPNRTVVVKPEPEIDISLLKKKGKK